MARLHTVPRTEADAAAPSDPGETTALALRTVSARAAGDACADFLARRLAGDVGRMPPGRERSAVDHLLCVVDGAGADEPDGESASTLRRGLVTLAGVLEEAGRLDDASRVLDEAERLDPGAPITALHAARVARKRGARDRALRLYQAVRDRSGAPDGLRRMAAVGEAMLGADPAAALGRVLRDAVRAGDGEAAGVAQEERARRRRAVGDRGGALRDYLCAAARFPEPVDRGRVLHEAADLMSVSGDLLAAREVLLAALDEGRDEQRALAAERLRSVARALGDELGRRRWGAAVPGRVPLVSLTPARSIPAPASRAPSVARSLRRLRPHFVPRR